MEGSGKTWKQDQRIRLRHVDTGGYLHSHDKKYTRIAGGQQEVTLKKKKKKSALKTSLQVYTLMHVCVQLCAVCRNM